MADEVQDASLPRQILLSTTQPGSTHTSQICLSSSVVALKSIEFHKQHLFSMLLELTLLQRESFEGEARIWQKRTKRNKMEGIDEIRTCD